jgi:hypothetical protein
MQNWTMNYYSQPFFLAARLKRIKHFAQQQQYTIAG